jgi:regulator of replication initiation timing
MSTSPSWFDQEKFTRLVKKVGKTVPLPAHDQPPGGEADNRPPGEGLASTARISLVSKPPSLLAENRALPALPRRTSALPSVRTHFQPAPQTPPQPPTQPAPVAQTTSQAEEPKAESGADEKPEQTNTPTSLNDEDLGELWQKMALLNEELAYAVQERDQALHENAQLVELLREAQEAAKQPAAPVSTGKTQELHLVSQERDSARKEYVELRKQYETLKKQEQTPKEDSGKMRKDLEQQLEAKNKEIAALKATAAAAGGGDEKMKEEMIALREQLAKAKEESSVAQRGLMLSQKALHETRDTLREATEGTSLSRHNFDNLKNECATLMEQNQVLQAQNDQLTRELAATKSKITSRL